MSAEEKKEANELDPSPEMDTETVTATVEEDIEALKAEAAKAKEHWERLLRTAADFENFRKRATREKQDAVKFANESLIASLLPVLDNFEAAMAATAAADGKGVESLQTGIAMVHQQLKKTLADAGLEEVDASGQVFDPNLHEAVSQQESAEIPEGHVLQQLRRGYKLRDRLLRPASVIVAKKLAK
jgi:molecular chaperone GrpE